MASVAASTTGSGGLAAFYVRWHFPMGCAWLLLLSLIAFWDNLVSDVTQPSNSNPVMIVHGLFLLAWMILLLVQASLPRFRRLDLHRKLGPHTFLVGAGVAISTVFLFVTVWKGWAAVRPEVLANRIFLPSYALCLVAAYRLRRRAEWHKRLVYCGTLLLSEPVLARAFDPTVGLLLPPMAPGADMPIFFAYMIIVWNGFFAALMLYDWLKSRRIHPATLGSLIWLHAVYAFSFAVAPAS